MPWLTLLAAVPLVGSAVVAALPKGRDLLAKQVTLAVSILVLALTVAMALQYDPAGSAMQFVERYDWIPAFGISYAVGVDGIALVLIAMAAVLVPLVVLSSWHEADHGTRPAKGFFALVLALEALIVLVFAATDLFLFYVCFEAMLLPIYFMIGIYGGPQRSYASVKFLLYSLLGGLLMLVALIGLYAISADQLGKGTFDYATLLSLDLPMDTQKWLFLGFFVAFAIKAPLWPLHTWLPDASSEATPGTAVLLIGILDKVGTFGMIRYCLPLFPDASQYFAPAVVVIAVVGILYGALLAIGQTDMMRLVAYTSVSHFGFIALGIFAFTSQGQSGSTLYMVNHGFSTAGLLLVVGYLVSRRGSKTIADYGGVQTAAPVLAGLFLVMGLSALSLPGLATFVSEILVLIGSYARYPVAAAAATLGIVLAALYVLLWYQRVSTGPQSDQVKGFKDLHLREIVAIAPIAIVLLVLGFYPKPVLDVINPAVSTTLEQVGVSDPAPSVGTAEGTAP